MIGITLTGKSGKYTTISPIGGGGFGSVFLATDDNGKEFAAKLIAPAVDPVAVATFRQEIESTFGLSHPNILRVVDWGSETIKGQPALFVISELCKDGDYRSVIRSYPGKGFPLDSILADFSQILRGLEVLHSKIIHRDLKPENVLRDGSVLKIGDYGLAKFVDEATRTLTFKDGGTPPYLAPEVWQRQSATFATDLYAVGVMLFEALTGRHPYAAATLFEWRDAHLYTPVPRPKSINPSIPDYLDGIVKKLLAKSARDRHQSASEVLGDFLKLGGGGMREAGAAAVREIAAQARRHYDAQEARSLEESKRRSEAEEETKRNLFARHQLVSLFDEAVDRVNAQLAETKITTLDSYVGSGGRAYQFGDRMLVISFFDRGAVFGRLNPGLEAVLRTRNVADAGLINITGNGANREGWNIVHLRPADAAYGDWLLFETRTSPLLRTAGPKFQPFATDATFFGENLAIHWKRVMHSYQLSEKPLEISDIYRILSLFMPKQ